MVPAYFVDTWFFVARADRFDSHYQRARAVERLTQSSQLVTHDGVLTELLAFFAGAGPVNRAAVTAVVRETFRRMVVVPNDRTLFIRALKHYEQRRDKAYSLTDCMSMVVMRDRGITHVLTNDHHFRQEGFTLVNE